MTIQRKIIRLTPPANNHLRYSLSWPVEASEVAAPRTAPPVAEGLGDEDVPPVEEFDGDGEGLELGEGLGDAFGEALGLGLTSGEGEAAWAKARLKIESWLNRKKVDTKITIFPDVFIPINIIQISNKMQPF